MICKLCLQEKKLVDAHIISRAFFEYMRDDDKSFLVLTNKKGEYQSRSQIGLYDNTILCQDCEGIIQKYDDYAIKTLLLDINNKDYILDPNGYKIGYRLDPIDYTKLKLFFLSVLWRASVSNRQQLHRVSIGPFEVKLRDMIRNFNAGDANDFLVILRRFADVLGQNFWMDPYKLEIDGINFYRFYLGAGYEFHIKVDKRKLDTTNTLYKLALKPNNSLYIPFRGNLLQEKEFPILKDILESHK